jgi:hypothetical protein
MVRVRGVRPRGVAMIAAVALASEEGEGIADAGPPEHDPERRAHRKQAHASRFAMEAQGVVRQALHGPTGEARGLLLEDGRIGRFPPHMAEAVAALLVPGNPVLLRGDGFTTPHGTVIVVRAIGASADDLRVLGRAEAPPKKLKDKPGKEHKPRPPLGRQSGGIPGS